MKMRHVGIVVRNMDKMLGFYTDIMGLNADSPNEETGRYVNDLLDIGTSYVKTVKLTDASGNILELLGFGELKDDKRSASEIYTYGISHIAMTVDDVDREYSRLKAAGADFLSAPILAPNGRAKLVFCKDPEGNFLELVQDIT